VLKVWYLDNMSRELNSRTVEDISRRLAELLALPVSRLKVKLEPSVPGDENNRADLLVSAGNFHFAVEWKASGQAWLATSLFSLSQGKVAPYLMAYTFGMKL